MKIAIVTNKMIVGGVEKALLNLLNTDDYLNKTIDLYLLDDKGEWMNKLPNHVNIIKMRRCSNIFKYIFHRLMMFLCKNNYNKLCYYNSKILQSYNEIYDQVISYHAPGTIPVFYSLYNLKGKNKILYIHGDIVKCGCSNDYMKNQYSKYDSIKCVSKDSYTVFVEQFPCLQSKAMIEYNVLDKNDINSKSLEPFDIFNKNCFNILTVARLSNEKGIDLAIQTTALLTLTKYIKDFKWYILGEGEEKSNLLKLIDETNVGEYISLLGSDDNPYKYMKNCDIYVQPSKHEGYCLTLAEALLLNKKCICTPFAGSFEQINDNNGKIVEYNAKSLADAIVDEYNQYLVDFN